MTTTRSLLHRAAALALLPLLTAPQSFAWGSSGHRIVNRLAAEKLPADVPAFLRTPEAVSEIEYLGPEPDRWRSPAEPELNAAQAPEHYIDLETADILGTLPHRRYDFVAALCAAQAKHPDMADELRPTAVGFQPYVATEVWERLKAAMREYRTLQAQHADTKPVEAAILFYAGWLGHYVGDAAQPLHTTVNHDGWVTKDNPNGYTTAHGIHWQFEGTYVDANIKPAEVAPLVAAPKALEGDIFDDYMAYLRQSYTLIGRVYELDKTHGFDGKGTPEARQFTDERLAAGASMLRDMIYTAWLDSAKPVPERHFTTPAAKAGKG